MDVLCDTCKKIIYKSEGCFCMRGYNKMYENPISLAESCLNTICDNILNYIEPHFLKQPRSPWNSINHNQPEEFYDDDFEEKIDRYEFRDPEIFLINEISEKLLQKFIEKKLLSDATFQIFKGKNTKLRKVRITNCRKITDWSLAILREHNIVDLEISNISSHVGLILNYLNDWTIENLAYANFSRCTFIDFTTRHSHMVKITMLKNLKSLNLAYTELNQLSLQMICEHLTLLENLNISGTLVKDLLPLISLKKRISSLSVCDMPNIQHFVPTIKELTLLKHLDVSLFNEKFDSSVFASNSFVKHFLEEEDCLPHLVSLDLSGWRDAVHTKLLFNFVQSHPKLLFLGIVLNSVTFDELFSNPSELQELMIAGLGNEEQIKVTLKKYCERGNYVQKALYHLFQLTNSFQEARPDMFNLVLPVMAAHSGKFGVQMAATACLYNLTRGELSKHIHPTALSKGVNLTLQAMSSFPDEFQLQKNSLLTLCSDRILQEVNFDRFRCAKLVLDALCAFDDVNMNRMAVAICSILAAKVSTEETSELGARPAYMKKLLSLVQHRVDTRLSDITLKFTLSALWNLTDESAATCTVFLEQGGAYLFLNVLRTFKDDSAIETKVLGLLNNIAEVVRLRHSLMGDQLMNELFYLLKSENIDVSYFAAGIVAHLASGGLKQWTVTMHTRETMLLELEAAVSQWKVPDSEMVAYRSFKPFFPLLKVEMEYQVQLWAVWAIHHVCTKNPNRYCLMLKEEMGHLLLSDLIGYCNSHPDIKSICMQILETLEINGI